MAEPRAPRFGAASLRARLLWRVLLPLAATWSIGSAIAFTLAWALAGRAFDKGLLDDAYAMAANVAAGADGPVLNLTPREVASVLFDREEKELFLIRSDDGHVVASNGAPPAWAQGSRADPVEFFDAGIDGSAFRVARLQIQAAPAFLVVIGQTTRGRQRLLGDLLKRSAVPQMLLLVALGAYLWRQITRELVPLGRLQRELDRRDSSELQPIDLHSPSADVARLGDAVNALLGRVRRTVRAQREFTGNVAHELRTPLAGIRALAEYGLAQRDPAVWREQLESVRLNQERASRFVDQLLALALADEAQESVAFESIEVGEVVRAVVLRYVAQADAAGFDLGAVGLDAPVRVRASLVLLEGVLTNLIENALRHARTEAGGSLTVALTVHAREVEIAVTDAGPGLGRAERESLTRRWTRAGASEASGGAGLGLAIATRYAALMGGRLELRDGPGGRGLSAVLTVPRGAEAGEARPAA